MSFTKREIRNLGAKEDRRRRFGREATGGRVKYGSAMFSATARVACDGAVVRAGEAERSV